MGFSKRLSCFERKVNKGFADLTELFQNHLKTHDHRDRFLERVIIALIGISGSAIVGVLLLVLKYILD